MKNTRSYSRCYTCGKSIPATDVVRREICTEEIYGGSTTHIDGQQQYAVFRMVALCPACAKKDDAKRRANLIGLCMVLVAVVIIYLIYF